MSHLEEGQLHELLDGELDEAGRASALAHLAVCDRCKAAYEEAKGFLAEADDLIESIQVPAMPVALAAAAAPAVLAESPTPANVRDIASAKRITRYRTLAWAASIVFAVGLGWYGNSMLRTDAAPETSATMAIGTDMSKESAAVPADVVASVPAEAEADAAPTSNAAPSETARRRDVAPGAQSAMSAQGAVAGAAPAALADAEKPSRQAIDEIEVRPPSTTAAPAPVQAPLPEQSPRAAEPKADDRAELGARKSMPAPAPARAQGFASADKARNAVVFRPIPMEEGVRILGGSIRLIDGLTPTVVRQLEGGNVIRVVYEDPPGRELWLDQVPRTSQESRLGAAAALLPGDTLDANTGSGQRTLRWVDQSGTQLTLTGYLPADSLRILLHRVR